MFTLDTPKLIARTALNFEPTVLEVGTCGLFRAPLHLASQLMPSMRGLIETAPVSDPDNWELDIKVHMLMPGQFPCIPNWHCDNVPRDESGLRYDLVRDDVPPMYLWISAGPETEFLANPLVMDHRPGSHQEVARFIQSLEPRSALPGGVETRTIEPNAWYSMDQTTPHRGTQASKAGWRVFARLTPKVLAPARPVNSVIRRHAQVYMDAVEFGW